MVQVVLPNDANPLGFILGGTVMHLIDIAGAIACHRHTRSLLVTAAVDGLQFLHPIKVGDLIILKASVTAAFTTSLEVEVEVFSEGTLTGERKLTSRRLSDVRRDRPAPATRVPIPPLLLETEEERQRAGAKQKPPARRTARRRNANWLSRARAETPTAQRLRACSRTRSHRVVGRLFPASAAPVRAWAGCSRAG